MRHAFWGCKTVPDPATPTVAAPAPINLAAESISRDTADVWKFLYRGAWKISHVTNNLQILTNTNQARCAADRYQGLVVVCSLWAHDGAGKRSKIATGPRDQLKPKNTFKTKFHTALTRWPSQSTSRKTEQISWNLSILWYGASINRFHCSCYQLISYGHVDGNGLLTHRSTKPVKRKSIKNWDTYSSASWWGKQSWAGEHFCCFMESLKGKNQSVSVQVPSGIADNSVWEKSVVCLQFT